MRKVYQACTHFTLPRPGSGQQPQVNLLRYDCVETPFTWDAMTAFDLSSINNLLNRPTSSEQQAPVPPMAKGGDLLGSSEDEAFAELEDPAAAKGNAGAGQFLDLSKMLETKKKQYEEKKKRVDAIREKEKHLVMYNPIVTKEFIDDRLKEIQNYKNKISQEKYFQTPMRQTMYKLS